MFSYSGVVVFLLRAIALSTARTSWRAADVRLRSGMLLLLFS